MSNISQRTHLIHPIGQYTDVLLCSYYLGAFGAILLPYETRCKTGRTSAKVRETKSCRTFRNERTRSTPLDNILTFCCVHTIWVHSGPFCCLMKLGAKRAELVQKFVKQSHVEHFATNAPDPPHWTIY